MLVCKIAECFWKNYIFLLFSMCRLLDWITDRNFCPLFGGDVNVSWLECGTAQCLCLSSGKAFDGGKGYSSWEILTSNQDLFTLWVLCTILVLNSHSEYHSVRESSGNDSKSDQTVWVPRTEQLSQSSLVWKSSNWWECERGLQGPKWSKQG